MCELMAPVDALAIATPRQRFPEIRLPGSADQCAAGWHVKIQPKNNAHHITTGNSGTRQCCQLHSRSFDAKYVVQCVFLNSRVVSASDETTGRITRVTRAHTKGNYAHTHAPIRHDLRETASANRKILMRSGEATTNDGRCQRRDR